MLFVILGHTLLIDDCQVLIYGFHMPLFFFLSGLVCDEKKYSFCSFVRSRFNSIVLPYIFFYLLTWLYWLLVERHFRPLGMEWWQPLIGMLYGAQWGGFMQHNGILWFLPCLFVTEVLFFLVKRLSMMWKQLLTVVALALVGFSIKPNLPWCLNIAFVALQFYYLGNLCRSWLYSENPIDGRLRTNMVSVFLIMSYCILSIKFMNPVNMATNQYGKIYFFEITALLGIIACVFLCRSFSNRKLTRFVWVGVICTNTLAIFAIHQPLLRIIRFGGEHFLSVFPYDSNLLYALLADVLVILFLMPFIFLWRKYGLPLLKNLYI